MQLSEAQMREAFEKEMGSYLAKLRGPHCMALSTKLSGEYAYLETEIAWRSWRAALRAQADARPVASARGLKVEAWLAQGLDGDLVRAEKLCRTEDEANDFMHTMTTVGHYKSVRKRPLVLGFGADSAATVGEASDKLDAPARVGNTVFRKGVEKRLVIEAAQRNHQRTHNPTEEEKRIADASASIARLRAHLAEKESRDD